MSKNTSIHHAGFQPKITARALLAGLCVTTAAIATAQQPPAASPAATATAAPAAPIQAPTPVPPSQPATFLAWDAASKDYDAKPGELTAPFTFWVTNVSSEVVVIRELKRSCGCTEARLPEQPWQLSPGKSGAITATIDLRGKGGRLSKLLTVESSAGSKTLSLNVNIPPAPPAPATPAVSTLPAVIPATGNVNMDRARNIELATANRQAVFSGDCAICHVQPTVGKMGRDLYQTGCTICHEAEHRAPMVTDLHALKHPTTVAYWKQWIASSKPGSLMPAFARSEGGPLSDEQINSLADYLAKAIPGAG